VGVENAVRFQHPQKNLSEAPAGSDSKLYDAGCFDFILGDVRGDFFTVAQQSAHHFRGAAFGIDA